MCIEMLIQSHKYFSRHEKYFVTEENAFSFSSCAIVFVKINQRTESRFILNVDTLK